MWGQATIAPTKDNVPSSPLIGNRLDGLRQKVDAFLNESMTLAWQEWHRAAVAAAATATAAYADATDPIKNRVADWVASAGGCLDGHADETQLINHLKCLAWYSAGGVDMDNPPVMDSNQIGHFIITNNALLNELGLCQTLTTLLKRYAVKKEEEEEKEEHTEAQISDCLTITYLLLICNEHWTDADVHFDIDLLSILIRLLTKQYLSTELARKLFLTLHAGLLTILGDADDAAQTQAHLEKAHNLPGQDHPRFCSVKDLCDYKRMVRNKYVDLDIALPCSLPLDLNQNDDAQSMGVSRAMAATPLPFETNFPPKSPKATDSHNLGGTTDKTSTYYFKKELELKQSTTASPYETPYAILEAKDILMRHLKVSLEDIQLAGEKQRARVAWGRRQGQKQQGKEQQQQQQQQQTEEQEYHLEHARHIHRLYMATVHDIPNFIHVCLRYLLRLIFSSPPMEYDTNFIHSITSTLILLMHWFKVSHVLKYERLAAALMDTGGLLLLIRTLVMHDIKNLLTPKSREDAGYLSVMGVHTAPGVQSSASSFSFSSSSSSAGGWDVPSATSWHAEEQEQEQAQALYDPKAEAWLLHTLQILHMITQDKVRRIKLLVLYKSSAALKRVIKACPDSELELYALKLLKSQVGYLGYRWRSRNMRTISAISRRCSTRLVEDWLTQVEDDTTREDFEQEAILRILIRLYHGRYYVPNMLPPLNDEILTCGITHTDGDTNHGDEGDEKLCEHTKENASPSQPDTSIGTPAPGFAPPVSFEALTQEINKLYHQPIRTEPEEEVTDRVDNGWDTPTPQTTSWGRGSGLKMWYYNENDEDDDGAESDPEVDDNIDDPLQNINWETLTLEEMSERLNKVEESTPQRWLSVAIDDPQYCKVLTDVEGLDDEEEVHGSDPDLVDDATWS